MDGARKVDPIVTIEMVEAGQIPNRQIVVRGGPLADQHVRGTGRDEQQIVVPDLQIAGIEQPGRRLAAAAVAATDATLVLLGLRAQHHVAADRLTGAVHAHVERFIIAARSVRHLRPVPVVEPLAHRHTVQLAGVRRPGVRYPLVPVSLERDVVKLRTLLLAEVQLALGTVLMG